MIGQTISQYSILEKLGGGMGIVYEAEDTKLRRFAKILRFVALLLVLLSSAARADGRRSGSSQSPGGTPAAQRTVNLGELEGIWGRQPQFYPLAFITFEFRRDGTCLFCVFGERNGTYEHIGDYIRLNLKDNVYPESRESIVTKANVSGDSMMLQMFGDLPACPFHRIGNAGSSPDPLVGMWASEECDIPASGPDAYLWKALVSSAVYTFAPDNTLHMRYRLEERASYTIKDSKVSCPVSGMAGRAYTWAIVKGTPLLVGENRSFIFVRQTLAQRLADQYILGDLSEENVRRGNQAIAEFRKELEKNPNDLSAIGGIGALLYLTGALPFDAKRIEESRTYHQRHIHLQSHDPEPHEWVGVIDWMLAYRANEAMRHDYNAKSNKPLKWDDPLPPDLRDKFAKDFGKTVNDGIAALREAIELRPNYDYAMSYLNLLYRQKADMVGTVRERAVLLEQADDLIGKVIAARKAGTAASRAEVRLEDFLSFATLPPPPPPPPPPQTNPK